MANNVPTKNFVSRYEIVGLDGLARPGKGGSRLGGGMGLPGCPWADKLASGVPWRRGTARQFRHVADA
jgi:hypothetical protein